VTRDLLKAEDSTAEDRGAGERGWRAEGFRVLKPYPWDKTNEAGLLRDKTQDREEIRYWRKYQVQANRDWIIERKRGGGKKAL